MADGALPLSTSDFKMIAAAVGITRDKIGEDQRGFAGRMVLIAFQFGVVEFGIILARGDRTAVAQFAIAASNTCCCSASARDHFEKRTTAKRGRSSGCRPPLDIDRKAWKRPAMNILIARAGEQRQREGDIIDAPREKADVIERRT